MKRIRMVIEIDVLDEKAGEFSDFQKMKTEIVDFFSEEETNGTIKINEIDITLTEQVDPCDSLRRRNAHCKAEIAGQADQENQRSEV